jgi:hypothetical protein
VLSTLAIYQLYARGEDFEKKITVFDLKCKVRLMVERLGQTEIRLTIFNAGIHYHI